MKRNPEQIISENTARNKIVTQEYNPYTGVGSTIKRTRLNAKGSALLDGLLLPDQMFTREVFLWELNKVGDVHKFQKKYSMSVEQIVEYVSQIRVKHDFEFWAATSAYIKHKETSKDVLFILNRAQRKLLEDLERMRQNDIPIRVIVLKARQWGGSTLIQIYAQWIQVVHKKNWNSVIIGDVEGQSRNIKAMYRNVAVNYPEALGTITLNAFEGSSKNIVIEETGCVVSIGSMQKPDSLRSSDIKIAHFSEVGLWKATEGKKPEDLIQAVKSSIPFIPYTLVAEESTAKGINNYFHRSWQGAESGRSGYAPVFIPWYLIERYALPIENVEHFISQMNEYDWFLWGLGATLEGIKWYNNHLNLEMLGDSWRMHSEFPSTPQEAFESTGKRVFAPMYTENIKKTCRPPAFIGEIYGNTHRGENSLEGLKTDTISNGNLWIWQMPDTSLPIRDRYAAFADIGGRTEKADYSVIRVIDRYWMLEGGKPEIVATWRGHLDQDLFAWKCAQIAAFYDNALLAIESNSLKTESSEGDHFLTVLDEISDFYDNLFVRNSLDTVKYGIPAKYGFHTNKSTKVMIINSLNAAARESSYIERDIRVFEEMSSYEIKQNGSFGAIDSGKDDLVMSTAGLIWLALSHMDAPQIVTPSEKRNRNIIKSIANF